LLARRLIPYLSGLIALIVLGLAGELPYFLGFVLYSEQALAAILALSLALVFLGVSVRRHKGVVPWYDWLAAALGLGAGGYTAIRYPILAEEFFFRPVETTVLGVILILLVVEALRRTSGWSLLGVLLMFSPMPCLATWSQAGWLDDPLKCWRCSRFWASITSPCWACPCALSRRLS